MATGGGARVPHSLVTPPRLLAATSALYGGRPASLSAAITTAVTSGQVVVTRVVKRVPEPPCPRERTGLQRSVSVPASVRGKAETEQLSWVIIVEEC